MISTTKKLLFITVAVYYINTSTISVHRWKTCCSTTINHLAIKAQCTKHDDGPSSVQPHVSCKSFHCQLVLSTSSGCSRMCVCVFLLKPACVWQRLSSPLLCPLLCSRSAGQTLWLPVWLWQSIRKTASSEYRLQRLIHILLRNYLCWSPSSFLLWPACHPAELVNL